MKLFVETNPKKENFSFLTPHSGISKMKAHQYFVFMEYFYVLLILIYNSKKNTIQREGFILIFKKQTTNSKCVFVFETK